MKLVSVETPEKSVCKMTFSASAEELEAASNAVYERTRATYTIKGFAKGEADRAQIEADRGEHTFWYDAINDLMDKDVPALYDAAMKEHSFKPVDEPSYDLVSVKKDEGFVATATTALQPELDLTQTTGFKTECVTPEVTDKEIDAVLERRRNAAAELVPHKGPAVKGNVVHMDFEGLLDGVAFQGGTAQNQSVQLGSGRMIPGIEDGILGHKAGDEFDIHVTFPERYRSKELAGKAVVFKVKLHDVCVRQLPSMNSDFAKKVGGVDTMEEFREKVRKQLYDGRHGGALNRAKDQVLAKLADAAEGELPSVLVESTYQHEMENIQQQLQMQRLSLDRYLSQIHQTRENFTANVHTAAEKNTRARMALLQVAQSEGLLPTEEEIESNRQSLLSQWAYYDEVTDRAVEDGDTVNINYVGSVNNVEFTGGSAENYDLTLGSGTFIDGFEDQIIGHKPGETFDVNVTFPDGYSDSTDANGNTVTLSGQKAVFTVVLNYISESVLPELTDSWVASTFGTSNNIYTVEALRAYYQDQLYTSNLNTAVMDDLMANSTFKSIPQQVMDYQVNQCLNYYYTMANYYGYDLDSFLQTAAGYDSADALLENMSDSITQYAREALLYQAVAEAMDIAPTQEQVDTYSTYTETYGANYCTMVALMDAVSDALTTGAQVA